MLSDLYYNSAMFMHTIAPLAIIILIGVVIWLLFMGKKWKTQDPERWNRKY